MKIPTLGNLLGSDALLSGILRWCDTPARAQFCPARCIFCTIILITSPAFGAIWFVDIDNASGTENGTSWAEAYADIQSATDAAYFEGGGEVWVAEGTYTGTTNPVLALKTNVELYGGFNGTETSRSERHWGLYETIIDAQYARQCVYGAQNATLDGFTVTHGNSNGDAGGIKIWTSQMTLRNCHITNNNAKYGGGLYTSAGATQLTVIDCVFSGNSATGSGGGMTNFASSPYPTLTNCTFIDNSSPQGGAIYLRGSPTFTACTFSENTSSGQGGAIVNNGYATSTHPTYTNCYFFGNSASTGGVMGSSNGSKPTLTNCLLWNNSANYGGAIFNNGSSWVTMINCSLYGNTASSDGGAMMSDGNALTGAYSKPVLINCILWGSSPQEIYNIDATPQISYSIVQGGYPGAIGQNPLFLDASIGDFRLGSGSAAIDSGTATGAPDKDIAGTDRPQGAGFDMGAYEFQGVPETCVDHSPVWIGDSLITYNLRDDLDIIWAYPNNRFAHAHAGNLVAQGLKKLFSENYVFNLEDELTPESLSDIFVTSGRPFTDTVWKRIPWADITIVDSTLNSNDSYDTIEIEAPSGADPPYYLYRYLHFETLPIDSATTREIVVIHGRNPDGLEEPYNEPYWNLLSQNLDDALSGSDWDYMFYDWHLDASTGGNLYVYDNAPESAQVGHQHGLHLGESMLCQAPNLEMVQLIAHSAGAWVARSAARILTQNGVLVQITLLDPYVPAQTNSYSILNNSLLDGMAQFGNIDRLENYYVVDDGIGQTDLLFYATSQEFLWSFPVDLNLMVSIPPENQAFHEDPISWYAQTFTSDENTPEDIPYNLIGWPASIAYPDVGGDPIWCDFNWTGPQHGTQANPLISLIESVIKVKFGGTIKIKSSSTSSNGIVIDKPMQIKAIGGPVRIGGAAKRSTDDPAKEGFVSSPPKSTESRRP